MGEREAGDVDTSRAGTRWRRIDGTGITLTEVARLVGGLGLPAEVKLEPSWREGGSWWNAAELREAGIVEVADG